MKKILDKINPLNPINKKVKEYTKNIENIHLSKPGFYRIAITGLSQTGKTVFITSLIDQLLHKDKIPSITSKKSFQAVIEPPKIGIERFYYHTFIKKIKNEHIWPKGTDEITSFRLKIKRKHNSLFKSSSFTIELIDYPGEWLLDLSLIGVSFEEWSKNQIEWLKKIDEEESKEYLSFLTMVSDGKEIANRYKEILNRLREKNYTNLIPGRFIMPSDLKNDPILDFAPILDMKKPYAKNFKKNYERYVKEIVTDIQLKYFKGFDRQIVLIDVIKALQNGPKCYKDMKNGLNKIVSLYDHKRYSFLKRLFTPTIKKVIFAAPKCDLVSLSQRQNYKELLNKMVKDYKENLEFNDIKTYSSIFAAVKCTQSVKRKYQGNVLSCIRGIDSETKKMVDHYAGEIPPEFPKESEWNEEDYQYKIFLPPSKDYSENEAVEHINMDEIIDELIGDLL